MGRTVAPRPCSGHGGHGQSVCTWVSIPKPLWLSKANDATVRERTCVCNSEMVQSFLFGPPWARARRWCHGTSCWQVEEGQWWLIDCCSEGRVTLWRRVLCCAMLIFVRAGTIVQSSLTLTCTNRSGGNTSPPFTSPFFSMVTAQGS
jgi:hypothetical protein